MKWLSALVATLCILGVGPTAAQDIKPRLTLVTGTVKNNKGQSPKRSVIVLFTKRGSGVGQGVNVSSKGEFAIALTEAGTYTIELRDKKMRLIHTSGVGHVTIDLGQGVQPLAYVLQ